MAGAHGKRNASSNSAKKRRKSAQDKLRCSTRVVLKDMKTRWERFKVDKHLKKDDEVAKFLLDSYVHKQILGAQKSSADGKRCQMPHGHGGMSTDIILMRFKKLPGG